LTYSVLYYNLLLISFLTIKYQELVMEPIGNLWWLWILLTIVFFVMPPFLKSMRKRHLYCLKAAAELGLPLVKFTNNRAEYEKQPNIQLLKIEHDTESIFSFGWILLGILCLFLFFLSLIVNLILLFRPG